MWALSGSAGASPGFAQKPDPAQKLDCQNGSAQKLVMNADRRQKYGVSNEPAAKRRPMR